MAKKNTILVKLESTAGTGTFYVKKKNTKPKDVKKKSIKLEFNKYDRKIRKHVLFVEKKLK